MPLTCLACQKYHDLGTGRKQLRQHVCILMCASPPDEVETKVSKAEEARCSLTLNQKKVE